MTTTTRQDPADKAKIDAIEKKLLANPEIAKLIDDLGTSTTDANDLVRGMLQASITRGLNAEMEAHLGYESGDSSGKAAAGTDNYRNGSYPKTVDSNYGPVTVDTPRDRAGTFIPTMIPKGSRRLTDLDDMIISLYAGGMTIRDIQHHMATTMRVVNKSAYLASGVDLESIKHILGLWIATEEDASLWAQVCANLSNRGVKDVFIGCCDGFKGLPEAVEATWPNSMVQSCIVHLIRAANGWVAYGDRRAVSAALKKIYTATDESTAHAALSEFEASELGQKYPRSVKVWRDAWERFVPFLQFPPVARKVIYTTNSIESFNNELRKATGNRVQFTNDESAIKTLWLMICAIEDKRAAQRAKDGKQVWATVSRFMEGARVSGWKQAINQMAVAYPDRFGKYL